MAVALTRRDHSASELRMVAGRVKDANQARRLLAIALVLEDRSRTEAAKACGMDRQTLRDWVHRYNAEGAAGLIDRETPGRAARLTPEQEAELKQIVEAGPDLARDGVVRWRRVDLAKVIAAKFAVTYHERTVGKVLAKLGFRRLSVRPHHPEVDHDAQAAFKKTSRRTSRKHFPPQWSASPSKSGSRCYEAGRRGD